MNYFWSLPVLLLSGCLLAQPLPVADEQGRRIAEPEPMDHGAMRELQEQSPVFADLSMEQIHRGMQAMGSDYSWAPESADGDTGLLVLAHGFGEKGDAQFMAGLSDLTAEGPVAVAFGMSMMGSDHLRWAAEDLRSRGAERLIAVPAAVAPSNSLYQQWQWILGEREEPAYLKVPQHADLGIVLAEPMQDHPLAISMLRDYALELSESPGEELVILVAHGPTLAADNEMTKAMLGRIADDIQKSTEFSGVVAVSLQDDAPKAVRTENVLELRTLIESAAEQGKAAIVVPYLVSSRGVQTALRRDLRGLRFRFSSKGMAQHPQFSEWIRASAQQAAGSGVLAGDNQ